MLPICSTGKLFILFTLSKLSLLFYFFLLGEEPRILAHFSLVGLAAYLAKALYKLDYFKSQYRFVINGRHLYTYLSLFCAALFILGNVHVTFSDTDTPGNGSYQNRPDRWTEEDERIAELTNDLNPDIVAISGDLADGFVTLHREVI